MKKPVVIRKPRQDQSGSINKSGLENIGGILNKLDPQQLISLANNITNFASAGFEYASEREKTRQVEINSHIRSREIEAGFKKSYLEHEQLMTGMQLENNRNEFQFRKDMENIKITATELERKDNSIHRILDLLEAGKISEDILIGIIHELKQ